MAGLLAGLRWERRRERSPEGDSRKRKRSDMVQQSAVFDKIICRMASPPFSSASVRGGE
jgi:hypothetical protein